MVDLFKNRDSDVCDNNTKINGYNMNIFRSYRIYQEIINTMRL